MLPLRSLTIALLALAVAGCGATPPTAPDAVPVDPTAPGAPPPPDPGTPPPSDPGAPPPSDPGAPPPSDPGTSAPPASSSQGSFVGVGHRATGTVRFAVNNGIARLDFSADFSVSPVPGPFVYVNTTNNANSGTPLRVSALQRNSGAQSYTFQVPAGVRYTFVLVWCDPFNVPVAEAAVPPTP